MHLFAFHVLVLTFLGTNAAETPSFAEAVEEEFCQLVHSAQAYVNAKTRSTYLKEGSNADSTAVSLLQQKYSVAVRKFAAVVERHWQTDVDPESAKSDYEAASQTMAQYREGKVTREAAVEAMVSVADSHPGSYEHDEALFLAAMMYVQGLKNGAKLDRVEAAVLLERLIARPGPPSSWTMLAEEELASYPNDNPQRIRMRSEFLKRQTERQDLEWLKANYLVVLPGMTAQSYVRLLTGSILNVSESIARTSYNVIHDASDQNSFAGLKELHPSIEYIDDAIKKIPQPPGPPVAQSDSTRFFLITLNIVVLALFIWFLLRRHEKT